MSNEDSAMNGEDFSQDVSAENAHSQNGAGDAPQNESGSADIPGRDDDRKLFVGGMSWETTDKELREYFGKYGEIESINVKTDPNTGRSRGFAFIVFTNTEAIDKVLNAGDHIINGKKIDPKKAKARHGKIFVGGLTAELSDDDIKNYFGQFGQILEVEMPFDKTKNQRKAFCFITFESEQVVNDLLKMPKQKINEVEVDVKKATPRLDQMSPMSRGGRGGRGAPRGRGGRGGYNGWNQGYGSYNSYSYPYDGYNQTDYYGGGGGYGNYGGYDYYAGSGGGNYVQGYGYNGGYGSGRGTFRGRGGPGGGGGGYQGNKPRGGGAGNGPQRQQRHQPY